MKKPESVLHEPVESHTAAEARADRLARKNLKQEEKAEKDSFNLSLFLQIAKGPISLQFDAFLWCPRPFQRILYTY